MTLAMVKVLPEPVTPSRVWCGLLVADPLDELVDRPGLVAGGLVGADQLEVGHGRLAGRSAPPGVPGWDRSAGSNRRNGRKRRGLGRADPLDPAVEVVERPEGGPRGPRRSARPGPARSPARPPGPPAGPSWRRPPASGSGDRPGRLGPGETQASDSAQGRRDQDQEPPGRAGPSPGRSVGVGIMPGSGQSSGRRSSFEYTFSIDRSGRGLKGRAGPAAQVGPGSSGDLRPVVITCDPRRMRLDWSQRHPLEGTFGGGPQVVAVLVAGRGEATAGHSGCRGARSAAGMSCS